MAWAVVLAAQGKSFCAGANFGDGSTLDNSGQRPGEQASPVDIRIDPDRACHVEAAGALWSYARASAEYVFGDRLGDQVADRLLAWNR